MSGTDSKNMDQETEEEPFGLGCALEMFTESKEVFDMLDNIENIYTDKATSEKAYERFSVIIGQYKEQPHLLDPHLDELLSKCITAVRNDNAMEFKHEIFRYLFVVVNVRGYKVIVRHLPHEVSDFEAVLRLLEAQNHNDPETWTTRYVLLLWLSIIIMIPFHLSRFDGFNETDKKSKTVMFRVLEVIRLYVVVPDKCRDAAAYLSARFITRNDVKEQYLSEYLKWAISLSTNPASNIFIQQGTLASVAMILKHGKREDLLPHATTLLQWIINDDIKQNAGTNVQKLVYKLVQRIGLTFLPPRLAAWRYKRGNRSLAENLSGGDGTSSLQQNEESVDEEDIEVPDEMEEVIDQLIHGLRSTDGIVRWSAAKGVGRVTGRLPQDLADEVVGSVLELFNPREGDGAWHGGCLALAELGRRGLLLPKRLPEVVPVVLKALVYDEPRGYSSVGSHIRDAACYVCWSFARAYEKDVLKPFVNTIAYTLLIVTCFDREINCRRAASAAFQENVGRQGTFPHGIDILTVADFFAVSVRNNAYLTISPYIAQFNEYTIPMIEHLLSRKVDHWDCVIRDLTAKTLHNLTSKAPEYMVTTALPTLFEKTTSIDLNSRHGAVLAIGEIIHALSLSQKLEDVITPEILNKIQTLIPTFREKFFKGLSGTLMRTACCYFIEKCSQASLTLEGAIIDDWLKLLNECISNTEPNIQAAAIKALPTVLSNYYRTNEDVQKRLVQSYFHELLRDSSQQEIRMGHALALGALPKFMLSTHLDDVITALIQAARITPNTTKWAESRRDSIKALAAVSLTMSDEIGKGFSKENVTRVYDVILDGLKDYTQDKRGDVGAWVREAAMTALQTLTRQVVKDGSILETNLVTRIIAGIAQQAVERIDRTRALAAKIFYSFLYHDPPIPNVPHHDTILRIFVKEECDDMNWTSAADTFPKFVELLQFPEYTYNVMLGMICSVGGLTETLVKNSSSSLFGYLQKQKKETGVGEINRLCEVVYSIFKNHQKMDRITIPMLRFCDKLFNSGCIEHLTEDPTSDFCRRLLKLTLTEISGCKDIYKLINGINLLSQFIQVKNEACLSALVQLSILLCHRQIYIRKSTASILYESLLIYGDSAVFKTENLDEIMQILSDTNWEEPVEVVKPVRNQLCNLMGIRVPVAKKTANS